jgi:hypothetical protein
LSQFALLSVKCRSYPETVFGEDERVGEGSQLERDMNR